MKNNSKLSPIVLFVYNRVEHTKRIIEMLKNCKEASDSVLYIISDAAKTEKDSRNVNEVREFINEVTGFKEIHIEKRCINYGIEKSETEAITRIINEFGKIIVLEDDLLINQGFLRYMNNALCYYEKSENVYSISAYSYVQNSNYPDMYFTNMPCSWGWGTWKRKWDKFSMNPKNINNLFHNRQLQKRFDCYDAYPWYDLLCTQVKNGEGITWDLYWHWTIISNNGLVLYPKNPLVLNGGFDGSGVHCSKEEKELNFVEDEIVLNNFPEKEELNVLLCKKNASIMKNNVPVVWKLKSRIKRLLRVF